MPEKLEYPKFKYHEKKGAKVVKSKEDEVALGKDWVDSPAEFGIESAPGEDLDKAIAAKAGKKAKAE